MDSYKEHLAAKVLSEGKVIDFRLLSHALKVHVNLAKQMLFEFHRIQNGKKPGSVHAVYCISGTRHPTPQPSQRTNGVHKQNGEDTIMQSSPPPASSVPEHEPATDEEEEGIPVTTIALVQEEHFEKTKAEFTLITSIYVHSLQPGPLENLQALSDCTRELHEQYANEDPLQAWKQYGIIHNPNVKRRTSKRPAGVVAPAVPPTKAASKPATSAKNTVDKPKPSEKIARSNVNEEGTARTQAGAHAAPVADLSTKKPEAPSLKRERSSLFAAFNKTKTKEKQPKPKEEETSQDSPMGEADEEEEEEEEDAGGLVPLSDTAADEEHRQARAARAQKLKDMMEDDDEDMADVPPAEDEPIEEEEHEQAAPIDAATTLDIDQKEVNIQVEGGRRRGRRRVMKKKVTRDAEGYMVTREEPAWESFSEEEAAPAPKRAKLPSASAPAATKGKGSSQKKGQGNLMSFFGKK